MAGKTKAQPAFSQRQMSSDPNGVIANWMRNRNTIEFLGIWEQLFNPSFNPLEFQGFRMSQGQVNDIKNNTLADVTGTGH